MPLISIVLVLIVVGFLLWVVDKYIPMNQTIKNILTVVVLIVVALWLLQVFGLLGPLQGIRVN